MTSRLKVHNSYFDKAFHAGNTEEYYLSLLMGGSRITYAVFNPASRKYIAFESVVAEPGKNLKDDHLLHQLLEEKDWLGQSFSKVFFVIDNPFSTLIPPSLFNEENMAACLNFNHPAGPDHDVFYNTLKTNEVIVVYGAGQAMVSLARNTWPNVQFFHCASIIIESLFIHFKNKMDNQKLFLHVRNKGYDLIYYKDNKLYFHNFFRFHTKEDFIYFLLASMEELHLNPEQIHLILAGDIDKSSILYEMIYRYIRSVHFIGRTDVFSYSYLFDDLKQHKHYALFNVLQCE